MVFIATHLRDKQTKCATTLTGLSRELTISYRQLLKYVNKDKLFRKHWLIVMIEPTKCKKKGQIFR